MDIGIVGLGLMGKAVAGRLLAAGHRVAGYDIAARAREEAGSAGVEVLPDARAVAASARMLILCLLTSDERRAVLWGRQDMASAMLPETVILDTITGAPEAVEEDAKRLAAETGARLVDVCVGGSSQAVAQGEALALIGGAEEDAGYRGVVETFADKLFFFGETGRGSRAKLVVNLVIGLHRAVLAEALGLAVKSGFDAGQMLEVLKAGGTYSAVMDTKGPKMVSGVYEPPVARLSQHAKDVGLILELAKCVGARAPLSGIHQRLLEEAVAAGYGGLDNAAVFRVFE